MSNRITKKEFYAQAEHLEKILGKKLETNVWHGHFSIYTSDDGTNNELLVSSNTARDAVDQIHAIKRVLYVVGRS